MARGDFMLSPAGLAASVTALAIVLTEGRSSTEMGILGAIFTQLGDTITTMSLQKALLESNSRSNSNSDDNSNGTSNDDGNENSDDNCDSKNNDSGADK
ncbi:MAG: hypothetical protein FWF85_05750 [Clostridiales bacterium]|jgi:hypothetical protein|nr:hypothetical protein [Clostridiales bacterium]